MGRLTTMPHRLGALPSKLAAVPVDQAGKDRARLAFNPLRALYKTARWRKLRLSILGRDLFTCGMCGRLEGDTSQLVCDHRRPHRGDEQLFWTEANLWCLCKPCHDGAKQREEQASHLR